MKLQAEDLPTFLDLIFAAKGNAKIVSAPGAGKSKQIEAYARNKNRDEKGRFRPGKYGLFVLDMSKANIADIQGYLMPKDETGVDHAGNKVDLVAGKFTYPYFLYDLFTGRPAYEFDAGMLLLEEWAQGGREEKRSTAPIILDRRLGRWHFPHLDCAILGNTGSDRSGETPEYDFLINRWTECELQPTLKGFLHISSQLGMTPLTQAFAARNEDLLFTGKVPEKQGPWMTQRSLHKLDDIFQEAMRRGLALESSVVLVAACGTVGEGPAKKYLGFMKHRANVPTISQVVNDPEGCKVPEHMDALTFLIFDLAAKTTHGNISAVVRYLKRLPSDLSVSYFNAAATRDEELVMTAEFTAFTKANMGVLTAISARLHRQAQAAN